MNYELTGTLFEKFDPIQRTATFKVREFVVENSKDIQGKTITNYIKFQCTQDRTDLIDKFNKGDQIRVHFNIRGSKWEKNGQVSYFNNLEAWRVEYAVNTQPGAESDLTDLPPSDQYNDTDSGDDLPF